MAASYIPGLIHIQRITEAICKMKTNSGNLSKNYLRLQKREKLKRHYANTAEPRFTLSENGKHSAARATVLCTMPNRKERLPS